MRDTLIMKTVDQIVLHSKCLDILHRKDIPYVQALAMIEELKKEYAIESPSYYGDDEDFNEPVTRSDTQELIDDDNRQRAADMNAVNRSPF